MANFSSQQYLDFTGLTTLIGKIGSMYSGLTDGINSLSDTVNGLTERVSNLYLGIDYCVRGWDVNQAEPAAAYVEDTYGDSDICFEWYPCLLDHTDNEGTTTQAHWLVSDNLLRYDNSGDGIEVVDNPYPFAPVVGITSDQYAECTENDIWIRAALIVASSSVTDSDGGTDSEISEIVVTDAYGDTVTGTSGTYELPLDIIMVLGGSSSSTSDDEITTVSSVADSDGTSYMYFTETETANTITLSTGAVLVLTVSGEAGTTVTGTAYASDPEKSDVMVDLSDEWTVDSDADTYTWLEADGTKVTLTITDTATGTYTVSGADVSSTVSVSETALWVCRWDAGSFDAETLWTSDKAWIAARATELYDAGDVVCTHTSAVSSCTVVNSIEATAVHDTPLTLYASDTVGSTSPTSLTEISHILRPWETTSVDYSVGIARKDTVYLLDNVVGDSGITWKGIFRGLTTWDGIDFSAYALVPTAICFGPPTVFTHPTSSLVVARNFFYVYNLYTEYGGVNYCSGGTSNYYVDDEDGNRVACTYAFYGSGTYGNNRTYPTTSTGSMQQINNMYYCRRNNADTTSPLPFAEGGWHAANTFITCQEVGYGSKYTHADAMFGSGISCNDSDNSTVTWEFNGGTRYRKTSTGSWTYAGTGTSMSAYAYSSTSATTLTEVSQAETYWLNNRYPLTECTEAQIIGSWAVETGIPAGVRFYCYGGEYYWLPVYSTTDTEVVQPGDGALNMRLYRVVRTTIRTYADSEIPDDGTYDQPIELQQINRYSMHAGKELSGDVFQYTGGGYEMVGTYNGDTASTTGNLVQVYLQPDQALWDYETSSSKSNLGTYDFEESYIYLGSSYNVSDGWTYSRLPYSTWKTVNGGGVGTYECAYAWSNCFWSSTANARTRIAVRLRGSANYSFCCPRTCYSYSAVSNTTDVRAGSGQAVVTV